MNKAVSIIRTFRAVHTENLEEEVIRAKEYLYQYAELDEKGLTLKEITYSQDGGIEHILVTEYNDREKIVDEKLIEPDGEISEHRSMEYLENGELARELVHYNDDTADETRFEYNPEGFPASKISTDSEGWESGSVRYEFSGKLLMKETEFDGDGDEISSKTFVYDDKGRVTEEVETTPEGTSRFVKIFDDEENTLQTKRYNTRGQLIERISYTFDSAGRMVESKEENASGIENTHIEYDDSDHVILQETTNEAGETLSRVERSYNEENQLETTTVNIEGRGQRMPQNYRLRFEYDKL